MFTLELSDKKVFCTYFNDQTEISDKKKLFLAMNVAVVGFAESVAVLANAFPPVVTEKIFKVALKVASGQRSAKLSDADALRVLTKTSDTACAAGWTKLTRHELQQAVTVLQLLAIEAVALGSADAFRKKLLKAAEKSTPPIVSLVSSQDRLSETLQALASQVTDDVLQRGASNGVIGVDGVTVSRRAALGKITKIKDEEFVCCFTPVDGSRSQAFTWRRVFHAPVSHGTALSVLDSPVS